MEVHKFQFDGVVIGNGKLLQLTNQDSIQLYNSYEAPTRGRVNDFLEQEIEKIKLFTLSGELILNSNHPTNTINLNSIKTGRYLVLIEGESSQLSKLISINK